jgi:hypothetical protein
MPRQFNNWNDLSNFISNTIINTVKNELKEETIKTVKKHIQDDVYDVYSPKEYERKHYLENSLIGSTQSNNDSILLTIEHDENLMPYNSVVDGSPVDGNDVAYWIENGLIYPLWGTTDENGNPYEYLKPRPYMKNAEKEILEKVDDIIENSLRKKLL